MGAAGIGEDACRDPEGRAPHRDRGRGLTKGNPARAGGLDQGRLLGEPRPVLRESGRWRPRRGGWCGHRRPPLAAIRGPRRSRARRRRSRRDGREAARQSTPLRPAAGPAGCALCELHLGSSSKLLTEYSDRVGATLRRSHGSGGIRAHFLSRPPGARWRRDRRPRHPPPHRGVTPPRTGVWEVAVTNGQLGDGEPLPVGRRVRREELPSLLAGMLPCRSAGRFRGRRPRAVEARIERDRPGGALRWHPGPSAASRRERAGAHADHELHLPGTPPRRPPWPIVTRRSVMRCVGARILWRIRTPHITKAADREANRAIDLLEGQVGLNRVNVPDASRALELLNRA